MNFPVYNKILFSVAQQLDEVRFKWHDEYCVGFFR